MTDVQVVRYRCNLCNIEVTTASFCDESVFCEDCGSKMERLEALEKKSGEESS